MSVIAFQNLSFSFSEHTRARIIFKKINYELNENDFHVIFGPSGSGKTTLLHLASGILIPSEGTLTIFEHIIDTTTHENELASIRKNIGYLLQSHPLPPYYSVFDFCTTQSRLRGKTRRMAESIVNEVLQDLGINNLRDQKIYRLSGGEKQRVALVAVLAQQPKLLLMDEPGGSIDTKNKNIIYNYLHKLRTKNQLTCIISTHDPHLKKLGHAFYLQNYQIATTN